MFRTAAAILAAAFLGLNAEAMSTKALAQHYSWYDRAHIYEDLIDCNCLTGPQPKSKCDEGGDEEEAPYCCKCH